MAHTLAIVADIQGAVKTGQQLAIDQADPELAILIWQSAMALDAMARELDRLDILLGCYERNYVAIPT